MKKNGLNLFLQKGKKGILLLALVGGMLFFEVGCPTPPTTETPQFAKVTVSRSIGGKVEVDPPLPEDGAVLVGTSLTFTAIPLVGYGVEYIEDSNYSPKKIVDTNSYTVVIDENFDLSKEIYVQFSRRFRLDLRCFSNNGTYTVEPPVLEGGYLLFNTEYTVTAIPNEGYNFIEWNNFLHNASSFEGGGTNEKSVIFKTKEKGDGAWSGTLQIGLTFLPTRYLVTVKGEELAIWHLGKRQYRKSLWIPKGDSVSFAARGRIDKMVRKWVGVSGEPYWDYEKDCEMIDLPNLSSNLEVEALWEPRGAFYTSDALYEIRVKNREVSLTSNHSNSSSSYSYNSSSLYIPATVMNGGVEYKVTGASQLKGSISNIFVSSTNENLSAVEGVLFNKAQTYLLCYPPKKSNLEYTIPETVLKITGLDFAFLKTLTCLAKEPPSLDSHYSSTGFKEIDLKVPAESLDLYKESFFWNRFKSITAIE